LREPSSVWLREIASDGVAGAVSDSSFGATYEESAESLRPELRREREAVRVWLVLERFACALRLAVFVRREIDMVFSVFRQRYFV
jgi:hypothetical protein